MSQPVSPDEITRVVFPEVNRSKGYDQHAVDDYLDAVVIALRTGTFEPTIGDGVTFPPPRGLGSRGYSIEAVDAFLDRIAATPPSSPDGDAPAGKPVPVELTTHSGTELPSPYEERRPGLLRRLFRP